MFSSVPDVGARCGKVPRRGAVDDVVTASVMFLTTVVRNTAQYCGALMQPSVSTQMHADLAAAGLAAAAGAQAGAAGDREDDVGALAGRTAG